MTDFNTHCPREGCDGFVSAEIETWGGRIEEFRWIGFECDRCCATWDRKGNSIFGGFNIASS